jgi:3,4-dihydroxy 2-butanone 4-phosphate synthase/GTP cyclohydrolase II
MVLNMEFPEKCREALVRARLGIDTIAAGKMVVVMDDLERENEGDLICAAEFVTAKDVAFMVRHTGGILCAPATAERLHELELHSMVNNNRDPNNTAFTISIDYRVGTTTGISASDRAKTFRALANPNASKQDFTSPGHVFPLIYTKGGVLRREGHTEASVDLCKLASLSAIAVISELINDDGEPKRLEDCKKFCETFDIPLLCVGDIKVYIQHLYKSSAYHIAPPFSNQPIPLDLSDSGEIREPLRSLVCHRLMVDALMHRGQDTSWKASTQISLKRSDIFLEDTRVAVFKSLRTAQEHPVIIYGRPEGKEQVLVRVHSECITGDLMGSTRCDCGDQLTAAYKRIGEAGMGIIIYVRGHEGRGISLIEKVRAYHLQNEEGLNTYEANHKLGFDSDIRRYDMIPEILEQLMIKSIRLLTNNPRKISALGLLKIDSIEPLQTEATHDNAKYLLDKQYIGGHRTNYSSVFKDTEEA